MTSAPPRLWPTFTSPLRSTALTSRVGSLLGIFFGICFLTGLLSHYQYYPWSWLEVPAAPRWGYRLTQGVHVATGVASIPLLFLKLWSIYPNLFRWPVVRSLKHAVERLSVFVLVGTALVQLFTGFFNTLDWYPWPWDFVKVHFDLAFVLIGSLLIHIGVKLPDIKYGLKSKLAEADVLTEVPWDENPDSHSNAGTKTPPKTPAITRRGLLIAAGAGIGTVVVTTVGQTITPLASLGLLATRRASRGPQGVPVNKTAAQARIHDKATDPGWTLTIAGPHPFVLTLAEIEALARHEQDLPITCVEGWSVGAHWRGVRLLSLVERAGGTADSFVHVTSLEKSSQYRTSDIVGPQVSAALLATHLNGERLDLDHGYPLRLIAPNRVGVHNTKWLTQIEVR